MADSPSPSENNIALENKLPRLDVRPRLLGAAKYTTDIKLDGMLHGRLVRSPFGLCKIKTADVDAAKANAMRARMRMVARQASLDPGDGIEL